MQARLIALKSAVPAHILRQSDVAARAVHLFKERKDIERLIPVFVNTGIEKRHSCVPIDWYENSHGWKERTSLYIESATALLADVAERLLAEAELPASAIDAIVVASTTGIATPSLDALLVERLKLRRDVQRLPIFGLGCAGGVIGLARAAQLAEAMPGAVVLFLVVELCALTFRKNDLSKSNVVATALFGDGAAGAIVSTRGNGRPIVANGEHTWSSSLDVMGWEVEEDGLKARFAQNIPTLVAADFARLLAQFLARNDLARAQIESFACHPGGAKVLDALETSLGLAPGALEDSRAVLRDYGNMSAATVLFVLERMDWRRRRGQTLVTALGPGFSLAFLMLDPS